MVLVLVSGGAASLLRAERTWPVQFPAAGNLAGKFFRIAGHGDDSRRIGTAASKGCGKFPAPKGQRIRQTGVGNRFEARREFARSAGSSINSTLRIADPGKRRVLNLHSCGRYLRMPEQDFSRKTPSVAELRPPEDAVQRPALRIVERWKNLSFWQRLGIALRLLFDWG